jgi:hypothetical protein
MIPKHLNAWRNHHINQSLMCLFDFWPTWVAKVVHVSSLMKGIVGELRLVIDTWHSSPTWYLLFGDECRWGTAPDLTCMHMVMMLGGYWVEGCLEKQNSRDGIGVFWEQLCTWLRRTLAEGYTQKQHEDAMQSLTFNATLNTKPSSESNSFSSSFFFFPPDLISLYSHCLRKEYYYVTQISPPLPFSCTQLLLLVPTLNLLNIPENLL